MNQRERDLLDICKAQIQEKYFPIKDGAKLRQTDFGYIIEKIQETSGIKLSLSTVKRIWSDRPKQTPHTSTLNALVSILGYDSWKHFEAHHLSERDVQEHSKQKFNKKHWILAGILGIASVLVGTMYRSHDIYISDACTFSLNKTVAKGVPTAVVFNYDLKDSKADSFFIQKSWNPRNKIPIDPTGHYLTETYYAPGFHWAKLMAEDSVIQWSAIHVQTDGWMATAAYDLYDPIPIYLDGASLFQNGLLQITPENYSKKQVDIRKRYDTRFYNVQHFKGVDAANFRFETKFRVDPHVQIVCPIMELMILTEGDVHYIALTPEGCIGNLALKFGEHIIYGHQNDLRNFGTDIYEWQSIEWTTQNKKVSISLNQNNIYKTEFTEEFGDIMGVIYTFFGSGYVDYIHLKNTRGDLLYTEEFNDN